MLGLPPQAVPMREGNRHFIRFSLQEKRNTGTYLTAPFPIERLHIIGGGAKNRLLNQFTANSTGVTVVAGPSEGTAIGNIMLQARAAGCVNSLQEMRDMISDAIEIETFTPEDTDAWNAAYDRIKSLIK